MPILRIISMQMKISSVPRLVIKFKKWHGASIKNNYNGKEVVDFRGAPLFAELAILRMYQAQGWKGVWVDSYGKKFRVGLPEKGNTVVSLSPFVARKLNAIMRRNKGLSGCWDVLIWKGRRLRFIEVKRAKRDRIRPSQLKFLAAALRCGISKSGFIIAEWDLV